jgi:DNA-binding transcriptional ArsR family regulator
VLLLELLAEGERTVSELSSLLAAESGGASQHLSALRRAGLVEGRKDGTSVVYHIRDERTTELLALARSLIRTRLAEGQALLDLLAEETDTGRDVPA